MPGPIIFRDDSQTMQTNIASELERIGDERRRLFNQLSQNGDQTNALARGARQAEETQAQALKDHRQAAQDAIRAQIRLNVATGTSSEVVQSQAMDASTAVLANVQAALDVAQINLADVQAQQDTSMATLLQECQDIQSQLADLAVQWQEVMAIQSGAELEVQVGPVPFPVVADSSNRGGNQ